MKYIFDNNISPKFAHMLRALDCDVAALREEFPANITDPDFLTAIAGRAAVFVTGDRKMTTRPHELAALKASGVTALFLGPFWSKLGFWKQAAWLVHRWPALDSFSNVVARGTFAEISQGGKCRPFQL